jgi:hypothetical protein
MQEGLNADGSSKMHSGGFFKVSAKAISAKELIRRFGIWRFPVLFLVARFARVPSVIHWMPQLWADLECDQQMLPEEFWPKTARHREAVEKMGFVPFGYSRLKDEFNINPSRVDNGKISYLHKNNSHVAAILYHKSRVPTAVNKGKEAIAVTFTAAFSSGSLSVTNSLSGFETDSDQEVVRIYTDDACALYDKFLNSLKRRPEQPMVFSGPKELQQLGDERQIKRFEARVRSGVLVKMTDEEIAQARRKIPPPLPKKEN